MKERERDREREGEGEIEREIKAGERHNEPRQYTATTAFIHRNGATVLPRGRTERSLARLRPH